MTENKIEPNRKTIAEFIFIAELSSECICKYVELGENSESVFALFNDKIKWNIEKFYETYRKELYYENDSMFNGYIYNPQIQISAESETKRSIFREKDKTKRSKKESAQHSKSRNKSFVMTSVSAL